MLHFKLQRETRLRSVGKILHYDPYLQHLYCMSAHNSNSFLFLNITRNVLNTRQKSGETRSNSFEYTTYVAFVSIKAIHCSECSLLILKLASRSDHMYLPTHVQVQSPGVFLPDGIVILAVININLSLRSRQK